MPLLEIAGVTRAFGGLVAVNNVSCAIHRGDIKAIIGPNGAGKTTLFNIVSGILKPDSGTLHFNGLPITGLPPHRIARLGISRTFQNVSLFTRMTVLENIMIGRHTRTRAGFLASALRWPGQPHEERAVRDDALRRLGDVGLASLAHRPAGSLSFGQRRMVELARALATEPLLLLLDEPASGLNTRETDDLAKRICAIRDTGVTILLVEHDMSLVMEISHDILVLNFGTPVAEGPPSAIRNNPDVISVYLGGSLDDAHG